MLQTQHITTMIENLKSSINEFNSVNSNFSGIISNTKNFYLIWIMTLMTLNERNTEIVDRFSSNVIEV